MAWITSMAEQLPKVVIFGFVLYVIVRTNVSVGNRVALIVLGGLVAAVVLGRFFDRFGLPEWVLSVVLIAVLFVIWLATWNTVF